MKLLYICEKKDADAPREITCELNGSPMEISVAIGDLIRNVNQHTPELLRPLFKTVIQQLVSDGSPVWRGYPDGTTVLDVTALRNAAEGKK